MFKGTAKPVWAIQNPKPILGAPEGKQRLRMRHRCEARLFVKTADGIRCFVLQDCGDHWEPWIEVGRNLRPSVKSVAK